MGELTIRMRNGLPLIELDYNDIEVLRNGVDDDTYAEFVRLAESGLTFEKAKRGFNLYLIKPAAPRSKQRMEKEEK